MPSTEAHHPDGPLDLADVGSFHVGGREVERSGLPVQMHAYAAGGVPARFDPNGHYVIEQMYCQYYLPRTPRGQAPLLLWHGGGMSGVTYEKTPDGRDGWLNTFLRLGWPVYNGDAVERGRAGWPALPDAPWAGQPFLMPLEHAVERFRLNTSHDAGASPRFPLDSLRAFGGQLTPRWTSTDAPTLAAYLALLERTGPAVVLAHSQGGSFALQAASARPDLVRALVLIEPANPSAPGLDTAALARVPTLAVYGDGIARDPRWVLMRERATELATAVRAARGLFDVWDLPAQGIHGNTHLMMIDRNNREIALLINQWLTARRLYL